MSKSDFDKWFDKMAPDPAIPQDLLNDMEKAFNAGADKSRNTISTLRNAVLKLMSWVDECPQCGSDYAHEDYCTLPEVMGWDR